MSTLQYPRVKKAIFVVAGFGTRFLPYTKAVPKEMLPLVDKPIVQYLVEEAVEAGITEIIFVTALGKSAIENHFDKSFELETKLEQKGKLTELEEIKRLSNLANYAYVRQTEQNGDGHAIMFAEPYVDLPEPVLVIFPDYIMPRSNNTIKKMVDLYASTGRPVIATDTVDPEKVSRYGILAVEDTLELGVKKVVKFVEKPKKEEAPSNLINNGYAIITEDIWKLLEQAKSTASDGEVRVADAFVKYLEDQGVLHAIIADKPGYDCGEKSGFVKATIDFALEREDLRDELLAFLASKQQK